MGCIVVNGQSIAKCVSGAGDDDDSRKRAGFATDLAARLLGRVSVPLVVVSAAMEESAER